MVTPRTGWGAPGDGSVLTQRGLGVLSLLSLLSLWYPQDKLSPLVVLVSGAAGGADSGVGVAATWPRPGGTLWVLVPVVRPCRGQGLQGGQQPLLEVGVEAEEEGESSQNWEDAQTWAKGLAQLLG